MARPSQYSASAYFRRLLELYLCCEGFRNPGTEELSAGNLWHYFVSHLRNASRNGDRQQGTVIFSFRGKRSSLPPFCGRNASKVLPGVNIRHIFQGRAEGVAKPRVLKDGRGLGLPTRASRLAAAPWSPWRWGLPGAVVIDSRLFAAR